MTLLFAPVFHVKHWGVLFYLPNHFSMEKLHFPGEKQFTRPGLCDKLLLYIWFNRKITLNR